MEENREVSLSWFVVSTRDYKKEYDWFWDIIHGCCYGLLKTERSGNISADLEKHYGIPGQTENYYAQCVLMPELQNMDISCAADYLREWCDENHIVYTEDLDQYKKVEAGYWGYDDMENYQQPYFVS